MEHIVLVVGTRLTPEVGLRIFHTLTGRNIHVDALGIANRLGDSGVIALCLILVAVERFLDGLLAAVLLIENVGDVVGAVAGAHIVDLARNVVGQLRRGEPDIVGTGALARVFAGIDGIHAQRAANLALVA